MLGLRNLAKLDAVILRIAFQFSVIFGVLKDIDMRKIFSNQETLSKYSHYNVKDTRIQFPDWYQIGMDKIWAFTNGIPVMNLHGVVECLGLRIIGEANPHAASFKHIFSMVFWLLYPVLVCIWIFLVATIAVKIVRPITQRKSQKQKSIFTSMLVEAGATRGSAKSAVADIDPFFLEATVRTGQLPSLENLGQYAGLKVVYEILAESMLQERDDLSEIMGNSRIHADPIALKNHLIEVLQSSIDEACLSIFSLERAAWAQQAMNISRHQKRDSSTSQRSLVCGQSTRKYPVCGMFRNSRLSIVFLDLQPVLLIALYSVWVSVTYRYWVGMMFVHLPWQETNQLGSENILVSSRWLQDMQVHAWEHDHLIVIVLACTGLGIWSVGFPVSIYLFCRLHHEKMQEHKIKRLIGFFYIGLEPNCYWWELLVKRTDVFVMYAVAYTHWLKTEESKLVAFMGVTAVFWVVHSSVKPFDNRRVLLADRTENLAFKVRFTTLFVLSMVWVYDGPLLLNSGAAVFLLALNVCLLVRVAISLVAEVMSSVDQDVCVEGGPPHKSFSVQEYPRRYILSAISGFLSAFALERAQQESRVPVFVWYGRGRHIGISRFDKHTTDAESYRPGRVFLRMVTRGLYCTADQTQCRTGLANLFDMFTHAVTDGGLTCWSPGMFDVFMVLPIAIKRLTSNHRHADATPPAQIVVMEVASILAQADTNCKLALASVKDDSQDFTKQRVYINRLRDFDFAITADDLAQAVLVLQNMPREALIELMRLRSPLDQTHNSVHPHLLERSRQEETSKEEEGEEEEDIQRRACLNEASRDLSDAFSGDDDETDTCDGSPSGTTAHSPVSFERRCKELEYQIRHLKQVKRGLEEHEDAGATLIVCSSHNTTGESMCSDRSSELEEFKWSNPQVIADGEGEPTTRIHELQQNCERLQSETANLQQRRDELHNLKTTLQCSVTELEQQVQELADTGEMVKLRERSVRQDPYSSPPGHLRYLKPRRVTPSDVSRSDENQATCNTEANHEVSRECFRVCI